MKKFKRNELYMYSSAAQLGIIHIFEKRDPISDNFSIDKDRNITFGLENLSTEITIDPIGNMNFKENK